MKIHNLSSDVYLAKKLYNFIGNCVYGSKLNYISDITGWCKRNVPCLKIPTLTAAMQWGLPWTAQSADFGKFYLNSLNLAPFLLLNPVQRESLISQICSSSISRVLSEIQCNISECLAQKEGERKVMMTYFVW